MEIEVEISPGLRNAAGTTKSTIAISELLNASGEKIAGTGVGRNWAELHIAHEIGHTVQARKWGPLYSLAIATTHFRNVPILNYFERNASYRGVYGGVK